MVSPAFLAVVCRPRQGCSLVLPMMHRQGSPTRKVGITMTINNNAIFVMVRIARCNPLILLMEPLLGLPSLFLSLFFSVPSTLHQLNNKSFLIIPHCQIEYLQFPISSAI
jgi:hypothetical protein